MKVGDLVGLAYHVTLKGYPHEDYQGLVVDIADAGDIDGTIHAIVNFGGAIYTYPTNYLRIISESETNDEN